MPSRTLRVLLDSSLLLKTPEKTGLIHKSEMHGGAYNWRSSVIVKTSAGSGSVSWLLSTLLERAKDPSEANLVRQDHNAVLRISLRI